MDWPFSKRSTCKCLSLLLLGCSKCSENEMPHFFAGGLLRMLQLELRVYKFLFWSPFNSLSVGWKEWNSFRPRSRAPQRYCTRGLHWALLFAGKSGAVESPGTIEEDWWCCWMWSARAVSGKNRKKLWITVSPGCSFSNRFCLDGFLFRGVFPRDWISTVFAHVCFALWTGFWLEHCGSRNTIQNIMKSPSVQNRIQNLVVSAAQPK